MSEGRMIMKWPQLAKVASGEDLSLPLKFKSKRNLLFH